MYAPHTVSLLNRHPTGERLTVLRGVMLQVTNSRSVVRSGDLDEAEASLYIPEFSAFLPPKEYIACPDPENHWTLQPEGESAGRSSFFVKGELTEALSLAEAMKRFDEVYLVAGYQIHDYGSPRMRHIEVHSKISGRFYYYN